MSWCTTVSSELECSPVPRGFRAWIGRRRHTVPSANYLGLLARVPATRFCAPRNRNRGFGRVNVRESGTIVLVFLALALMDAPCEAKKGCPFNDEYTPFMAYEAGVLFTGFGQDTFVA